MNSTIEVEPEAVAVSRFTRQAGDEPISGYQLLEPLGVGGFGEVWKCLAPGGLLKAIKIVTLPPLLDNASITPAARERAAMDRVKQIRHPFLTSIDRVDASRDELFVVMELADASLLDEFEQNRAAGRPGIPQQQLLHYLVEAGEVLDVLNLKHGLQHLDVKPANLLVVNRHIKLADFGLVSSIDNRPTGEEQAAACGVTPRYASPEMMQGAISASCDQYSLAVVYQELLTGQLPFEGNGLLKRLLKAPNLEALPETERPVVARALSPKPEDRFASCLDFVDALMNARVERRTRPLNRPTEQPKSAAVGPIVLSAPVSSAETPSPSNRYQGAEPSSDTSSEIVLPERARATAAAAPLAVRFHASSNDVLYPPIIHAFALEGKPVPPGIVTPRLDEFLSQLVVAKTGRTEVAGARQAAYREVTGDAIEQSFPMEAIDSMRLRQKFELIVKECRGAILVQSARFITFVVEGAVPLWNPFSTKQTILKTTVKIESPCQEQIEFFKATVRIEPFNPEGPPLAPSLINIRSVLLKNIRSVLEVAPERRLHERWSCNFGVALYPVHPDGRIGAAIEARAGDLSNQGIGLILPAPPETSSVYLRPKSPKSLHEFAILSEIVRRKALPDGSCALGAIMGRF
jgi:eukaryotic-like serine/threonine-protein kinase